LCGWGQKLCLGGPTNIFNEGLVRHWLVRRLGVLVL